ncbi:LysR family transcriptional regulator [Kiloniella sp. b19]|uniref:LysR family transcriptional regulator n=1 Tax=Kiloniella sp. GXU_MW_B19 TaxID=3141326 RepID=UPI0031D58EBF
MNSLSESSISGLPALVPQLLHALKLHGNMSLAAQKLGVSQPAASKALQRAEKLLGLELIRRDHRPLRLTAEGEILADYAERLSNLNSLLAKRLERARKLDGGLIRIASFGASSSTKILPRMLARIARHYPGVQIEMLEMPDPEALESLQDGRVDFAVFIDPGLEELETLPLAQDRLVALIPEGHALSENFFVTTSELAKQAFIMTKGGSEPLIRKWFDRSDDEPDVRHTAVQLTSILAMVKAGLGVSVIAEMAVPENHPGVRIMPLSPEQPRPVCIARQHGSFASRAAEKIWHFLSDDLS